MADRIMREIRPGEIPFDGGTALQEDAHRPVFRGNGTENYRCATCGNLLAVGMNAVQMTKKVRIRCGTCQTVNVADETLDTPRPVG